MRHTRRPSTTAAALGVLNAVLKAPFDLVATLITRTIQILFSIFVLILHPGFKWLLALLTRSRIVRDYLRPALQKFATHYYEPYFAFLRSLPPYWATFSIAVPLAALEPAKLYATILIVERPRAGVVLWLLLQGLSLVLIEKTWTAVRPQSRKIWVVSRLHAWGWLTVSYGKYWVQSSIFYRMLMRWQKRVRIAAQAFWSQFLASMRRQRS